MRYTPHDLRRTMATRLSDLGVMPHVIEKMLNHQMEGVMAVYNRAEYLEERKPRGSYGRGIWSNSPREPELMADMSAAENLLVVGADRKLTHLVRVVPTEI